MNDNTLKKAQKVQQLVAEYYEPGRQDRCKRWVWTYKVYPIYPMSERTFYRYLAMPKAQEALKNDTNQLKLF